MAQPTAQEQYMLELINQTRSDPNSAAAQYGTALNQGLASGTISGSAKQPLAFNPTLASAARGHSQWMLNTDTFSHTGDGGSSAGNRMGAAGYEFTGNWTWGENLAWRGTTGTPNATQFIAQQHEDLYKSPGHRTNLLNGTFKEIGIGSLIGEFRGYNAVMTTQNFARSGSTTFLTGVAFDDSVTDDDFYTVGEGLGGIQVEATRQSDNAVFSTQTYGSGGYQVALTPGTYTVSFSGNALPQPFQQTVTIDSQNVKLDLATDQFDPVSGIPAPEVPVPVPAPIPVPVVPTPTPEDPTAETIGEYGTLNLDHRWQTITLEDTYDNPVVIVSDPTLQGTDPTAVRLRNVGEDTFQIRLQEPRYKDDSHTLETVSYLVMEAGDWSLTDGTRISAGTQTSDRLTSQGFDQVSLSAFETAPTVLSQVQTYHGTDWVTTRTRGQSAGGFQLAMQEEEALNNGFHVDETIGWLAIEQGVASDGDTLLQGGTTDRSHSHKRLEVRFEEGFESAPAVIAKLGSFYGRDTANLRLDDISTTSFGVSVYEERSLDNELNHTNESVSFLALDGSAGMLTGLAI